ncbi:hypothetical protein R2F61_04445 [Mollicutes bacterium LVI A0078]|nr:hypothetical protein RZE84_04465 [Mollicutes bacterium LVI A0075]WOO91795.1 hypothetical protein R2F61_04445 [Mollicutes bacterium LVI A0078]
MFKNFAEKRFKKKFPGLKQVINEYEIDFDLYGQVPLKFGENSVYLKDKDEKRTVYTYFNVEDGFSYGLRIVYNYPYIVEKIKTQFIITIVLLTILVLLIEVFLASYIWFSFFIALALNISGYFWAINHYISKLGISAYKVEVVSQKK